MAEVAQVQLELSIVCNLDQPAHLPDKLRLAIRRQSHHLIFVTVMGEANELGNRRKKNSERVREINAVLYLYPISMAESESGAGKIAKAIDKQADCFLKTRND